MPNELCDICNQPRNGIVILSLRDMHDRKNANLMLCYDCAYKMQHIKESVKCMKSSASEKIVQHCDHCALTRLGLLIAEHTLNRMKSELSSVPGCLATTNCIRLSVVLGEVISTLKKE